MASRSQQLSANATRTFSLLSQPISKPSEHQRRLDCSTATRPSCDGCREHRCGAEEACHEPSSPGRRAWHLATVGFRCGLYGKGSRAHGGICRHIVDDGLDLIHQRPFSKRWTPFGFGGTSLHRFRDVRSGDTQRLTHLRNRELSFGNESERNRCFFDPDAISSASLRISPFIVFLPRRRCSSFTWF